VRSLTDRRIDLNADVGEIAGEEPLYALISSANIACGGHAGDETSMRRSVELAMHHGVAIGAHPSYPDRAGFGRVSIVMDSNALARAIAEQILALTRIAEAAGGTVVHVKPHGALYNDAATHPEIADAIAAGVASVSPSLVLVGLAGSAAIDSWAGRGLVPITEGFADRAYDANGLLVPRSIDGALITDPKAAAAQAVRLAEQGLCDTICVHGDTPGALSIARAVRSGLTRAGFSIGARSA
jgi:UPF0271 protein